MGARPAPQRPHPDPPPEGEGETPKETATMFDNRIAGEPVDRAGGPVDRPREQGRYPAKFYTIVSTARTQA